MQSPLSAPCCIVPTMKEDFNQLRMISHLLKETPFMEQWQWRVEIIPPKGIETYGLFERKNTSGISDFDLLAKGVDYDPITIESEPVKAGAITFNFPTVSGSVAINLTMRDAIDQSTGQPRFYKFFEKLAGLVINEDGTVNLSTDYLFSLKLVSLFNNSDIEDYKVFASKLGNITASVDGPGLVEYPATFMQFRSLGKSKTR